MTTISDPVGEVPYSSWLNDAKTLLETADTLPADAQKYGSLILAHLDAAVPSPPHLLTPEYFTGEDEVNVRIFDQAAVLRTNLAPELRSVDYQQGIATTISRNRRSAIILPRYSDQHPLVNAHILLHEGAHALDDHLQLYLYSNESRRLGASERRAYGLNIGILEAVVGKPFTRYVAEYPYTMSYLLVGTQISAQIQFSTEYLPEPPENSMLYRLWTCRSFFESVVRVARAESVLRNLPNHLTDEIIGNM